MYYIRQYIQFNDLVFDGYNMLSESDSSSVNFTVNMTEYTFRNGSYVALKKRNPKIESSSVSMTLLLELKKIACDLRDFYRKFVIEELFKAGKLWAVQNNEIVWAYAIPSSYSEQTNLIKDRLEVDIEFELPEGIWHKADKQKTFLVDHDICEFLRCKHYQKNNPCNHCCIDCPPVVSRLCCCCDAVCREAALCYNENLLQDFYKKCGAGYRIVYDCAAAERLFTDEATPFLGESLCVDSQCGYLISGQIYATTDLPTDNFRIIFNGEVHNPKITINGNQNIIDGDYTNLIVDNSGFLFDGEDQITDVSVWKIPEGNSYGWEIHPGENSIVIEPGYRRTETIIEDPVDGTAYAGRTSQKINGGEGATTHDYYLKASANGETLTSHALCINASYWGPRGMNMPTERVTNMDNVSLVLKAASIRLFWPDLISSMPNFWYDENLSEDTLWCRCHVLASHMYSGDIGGRYGVPKFNQAVFDQKIKPLETLIPTWYNLNTNGFKDVLDKFDLYIANGSGMTIFGYPLQSLSWVEFNDGQNPHTHTVVDIDCCTGVTCAYFQIDNITA